MQLTGTEATHVPSRGAATAVTDQIAGRAPISFQGLGTVIPYVRDGRLRPILVTSAARSPLLPEVPTGIESSLADFEVTSWQAAMAPAAIPAPVLHRLHEAVTTALRDPEVAPRLEAAGYTVVAGGPDYRAFQRAESSGGAAWSGRRASRWTDRPSLFAAQEAPCASPKGRVLR